VLIVDDHEVLSTSLSLVLDEEPGIVSVGVAATLAQARALATTTHPDVLLLDHRLPDGDGISCIPELRALRPTMNVVVLTASAEEHVLVQAIEAGAAGFVTKSRSLAELTSAVRAAAVGDAVIAPELLARLLTRLQRGQRDPGTDLTEREREVLVLLAQGMSNAAIADELDVSVFTVRNHVANLSAKLGSHSKLESLSIAVRQGLLPDL